MDYLFKNDLKTFSNDIHKQDGIKFVVEPKSLLHLVGTEMHYENTELSSEFIFKNPNVKSQCGCGESFTV